VKPDRQLPGDLERGQGIPVVTVAMVRHAVAENPDLTKQVEDLGRNRRLEFETTQQVRLQFVRGREKTAPRGHLAGQLLAELAELDQAGRGIIGEIAFCQSAEAIKLFLVGPQKSEVP
jgi:hypothetical protein